MLAEDLRERGAREVSAFDTLFGSEGGAPLEQHARQHSVRVAKSHADLSRDADLLLCAVTAAQDIAAARACAAGLKSGAWFLDFNSASPGAKQRASQMIDSAGGRYVEAAVMTAIHPQRIGVPLILGGAQASALQPLLNELGFNAIGVFDRLGVASATKMCRSIVVKGMEAMLVECLATARAYGVENDVIASLAASYPGIDWERQGAYAFQRVIQHGRRRSEEMREVAETVREAGLEPWSSSGTAERQAWMADLADAGAFGDKAAPRRDWRVEADRILAKLGKKPPS